MKRTLVQYRVKPECVAENEAAIRAVFASLRADGPTGFRYSSFLKSDGVSFVHLFTSEAATTSPRPELPAFKAFIAGIKDRCEVMPTSVELTEVGSYG